MTFSLRRTCDWFNAVEIALPNPGNAFGFNSMVGRVETEVGGQRIDALNMTSDLEAQVETNFAIMNPAERGRRRAIAHLNGTTFVSLAMAPFYKTNVTQPGTQFHEFKVYVNFCDEYAESMGCDVLSQKVSLFANKYYHRYLDDPSQNMEQMTFQNQFTGEQFCKTEYGDADGDPGPRIVCRLSYNHPVSALYFWGVDKSHIREVKVYERDVVLFESVIDALEHYKVSKGIHVDPVVFFFCDADSVALPGAPSLNFSRLDDARLVITLVPQCERSYTVNVGGINKQIIRHAAGMCGLRFSK